jgi:hypothetical protein
MVRLMQVGERLHNHTIGLLEPLRAFRFCSVAPAPHAKPCHDTRYQEERGRDADTAGCPLVILNGSRAPDFAVMHNTAHL